MIRAFFKKWPYVVKSPFRTFFSTKMEKNFVPRGWQPWSEDSSLVPGIVPRCFPPPPPPFKKKCRVFTFAAHFLSRKWGSGGRVPKTPPKDKRERERPQKRHFLPQTLARSRWPTQKKRRKCKRRIKKALCNYWIMKWKKKWVYGKLLLCSKCGSTHSPVRYCIFAFCMWETVFPPFRIAIATDLRWQVPNTKRSM